MTYAKSETLTEDAWRKLWSQADWSVGSYGNQGKLSVWNWSQRGDTSTLEKKVISTQSHPLLWVQYKQVNEGKMDHISLVLCCEQCSANVLMVCGISPHNLGSPWTRWVWVWWAVPHATAHSICHGTVAVLVP